MITFHHLHKAFGDQVVLEALSGSLPHPARIALVGQNGAGKSTLLNILSGLESVDSGSFQLPKGARLGYLPQEPNPTPKKTVLWECQAGDQRLEQMAEGLAVLTERLQEEHGEALLREYDALESRYRLAGGYDFKARAESLLQGLDLGPELWDRSPLSLSGGMRMRLELCKLLLLEPEVLLLDEPTNHLDLPSLVWVEQWLMQFQGTLIFVSHDRDFLNRLAEYIWFLARGELELVKGDYDRFLERRAQQIAQREKEREGIRKKKAHHEDFVRRFGAKATKAKQAQSRVKMIERLEALEGEIPEDVGESFMSFKLPPPAPAPRVVLQVTDLAVCYPGQAPLATGLQLKAERGQRIAIIGANGIGKSSFCKTLVGELSPHAGGVEWGLGVKVGYFAQNQREWMDEKESLIGNLLRQSTDLDERKARQILGGLLFHGDDITKPVKVCSGGEKNRLGLACLLAQKANVLILDEPTNHLDMMSVEILTEALREFTGTVLFVSHDRQFINALCSHVYVMLPDGKAQLFMGDLADYERMSAQVGFPNVLKIEPLKSGKANKKAKGHHQEAKALKSQRQKIQKSLQANEALGEELAFLIKKREEELKAQGGDDHVRLQDLAQEVTQLHEKQQNREEEWLRLAEELDEVEGQLEKMGRLS